MNWLTKAMIVLIVANSLSAKEFECKGSADTEAKEIQSCMRKKWSMGIDNIFNPGIQDPKKGCCLLYDGYCFGNNYVRKNCELKDGFDKGLQSDKELVDKSCTAAGIDPRKDCPSIAETSGTEKCKDVCSSAIPMNAFQPLCLIVISFVAKFLFF